MKQASTRKRINYYLLTWVGSYLLTLALPIILGTVVYYWSVNFLTEEVEKVNQKSMVEMRMILDSAANGTDLSAGNLILNPAVVSLAAKPGITTPADKLAAQSAMKLMNTYILSNDNIAKVGIYFHSSDYLLTSAGSARGNKSLDELLSVYFGGTRQQWAAMLGNVNSNTWYFLPPEGENKPARAFVLTDMKNGVLAKKGSATCVVSLNLQPHFQSTMQNMAQVLNGQVWLIPDTGQAISTDRSGALPQEYDPKTYTTLEEKSEVKDWRYVAVTSNRNIFEKVFYIKRMIWVYIAACLVIGGLLAYTLAWRYYSPINRISHLLAAQGEYSPEEAATQDKISYIQTSLSDLLSRYQTGQSTIHHQGQKLRYQALEKALLGEAHGHQQDAKQLEGLFSHASFVVIGFYIYDYSRLFQQEDTRLSAEDEAMMNLIIQNVSEEILSEEGRVAYTLPVAGEMVSVINLDNPEQLAAQNKLAGSFRRIMDTFTEMFGLDVSVAVSGIGQQLDSLPVCYQQMHEVIEYIHGIGEERVVLSYGDLQPGRLLSMDVFTPSAAEKECCDLVRQGKYEEAVPLLDKVFEQEYSSKLPVRYYTFLSNFMQALRESGLPEEQLEELLNGYRWSQLSTPALLRIGFGRLLENAAHAGNGRSRQPVQEIIEPVKAYVEANYADPGLGVSGIADHFFIHPSQLSRVFKKQTGIGLLDYIHQQRILHINRLLEGSLPLNEIARRTGYLNSLTMIRVYKRYENITPGRYREELRTKQG